MRRTSSRRSFRLYPGQSGRCTDVIESSSQNVGYVYLNTNGQIHGPVWKTQLFLLNGICTVIFWQDYHGNGNLSEKALLKYRWDKVPNWECFFVNREEELFLAV